MPSKAKFSNKIKEAISERDKGCCIICGKPGTTIHHVYYGINANRGPNRNNIDQGVVLDYECHHNLHNGNGKDLRGLCILYVKGLT